MLSRFHLVPERNGQTDRFAIAISRVSMLTRDKNRPKFASVSKFKPILIILSLWHSAENCREISWNETCHLASNLSLDYFANFVQRRNCTTN